MKYPGPVPYVTFDTNCLNSKGVMDAMNRLDEFHEQGLVTMHISETLWNELPKGHGAFREKACAYMFIGGEELMPHEVRDWHALRQILFPQKDQLTIQDKRDVQHLFDHRKYVISHWTFFVTKNRDFLDHQQELDDVGIRVGTPEECLSWLEGVLPVVRRRIHQYEEREERTWD